jgi:glycerol-3-phosphate O-acyltransferase
LLARLISQAIADPLLDVQLVPVVILWGRSPDKQDSVLKALVLGNLAPARRLAATAGHPAARPQRAGPLQRPDIAARSSAGRAG